MAGALANRSGGPRHAVGTSGTLRALCRFAARGGAPLVERDDLPRAVVSLAALGPNGRRRLFEERADHIDAR